MLLSLLDGEDVRCARESERTNDGFFAFATDGFSERVREQRETRQSTTFDCTVLGTALLHSSEELFWEKPFKSSIKGQFVSASSTYLSAICPISRTVLFLAIRTYRSGKVPKTHWNAKMVWDGECKDGEWNRGVQRVSFQFHVRGSLLPCPSSVVAPEAMRKTEQIVRTFCVSWRTQRGLQNTQLTKHKQTNTRQ